MKSKAQRCEKNLEQKGTKETKDAEQQVPRHHGFMR